MKFAVAATLMTLVTAKAFADSLVTCKTAAKVPVTVVEYVVKSTPSKRLNSPLFFTKNSVVTVINQAEVAQFGIDPSALYFLADNVNEIPTLRLYAPKNYQIFTGNVTEYTATGAIAKNTKVNCKLSAL